MALSAEDGALLLYELFNGERYRDTVKPSTRKRSPVVEIVCDTKPVAAQESQKVRRKRKKCRECRKIKPPAARGLCCGCYRLVRKAEERKARS